MRLPTPDLPFERCCPLQHLLTVRHHQVILQDGSQVAEWPTDIRVEQIQQSGGGRSESLDAEIGIQKQSGNVSTDHQVGHVAVRLVQFFDFLLKLAVDHIQLFVQRLQLFFRTLQFFIGGLQFFVHRHRFFVRHPELLVGRFQFLNRALQVVRRDLQLILQLFDIRGFLRLRRFESSHRSGGTGRGTAHRRFTFLKTDQQQSFPLFRIIHGCHGNPTAAVIAVPLDTDL